MQNEVIDTIIEEIKTELKSKYPEFRGIYLFGSRARGDFHEDSDIDIAVIFDRKFDRKFKDIIRDNIIDFEILTGMVFDSLIFCSDEINIPATPLREIIKTEGIYHAA